MTVSTPSLTLNTGAQVPQLGYGVFLVEPESTQRLVEEALEVGYRHIDTATGYNNEGEVGAALKASGIPRDELFITTKLVNDDQRSGRVAEGFEKSLELLSLDAVDLYLIHWPMPATGRYVDTWKQFVGFAESGRARSIGVSNFQIDHLEEVIAATGVVPAVNQVELHPIFQQAELRAFHREHGIATEAWGPLGQGKYPIFELPAIVDAAAAHDVTGAQVVLRWHVQIGNIAIPKSSSRERMVENLSITGFDLTEAELAAITALDEDRRVGGNPADVN